MNSKVTTKKIDITDDLIEIVSNNEELIKSLED